ncbi:GrpB family protein [Nocardia sp. NPDC059091]|uniref:GrpB family protein n=1 Tax=unclassified Nocardia TaxID=2637762 RepID=UPI0036A4D29E
MFDKRLFHCPAQAVILHMRRADSPFAEFVVLVRDWLHPHPDEAERYAIHKRTLAAQRAADPDYDDYARAKSASYTEIEPLERQWAHDQAR